MKKRKKEFKEDDGKYSKQERERFLYRSATEMRRINDAVEARYKKKEQEEPHENAGKTPVRTKLPKR